MKLKSFNYLASLLIIFLHLPLIGEEKIDIWKEKKDISNETQNSENENIIKEKINLNSSQKIKISDKIQIEEGSQITRDEKKVYGIFEPADYNFSLNMWSATKAEDLRASLKRLNNQVKS